MTVPSDLIVRKLQKQPRRIRGIIHLDAMAIVTRGLNLERRANQNPRIWISFSAGATEFFDAMIRNHKPVK